MEIGLDGLRPSNEEGHRRVLDQLLTPGEVSQVWQREPGFTNSTCASEGHETYFWSRQESTDRSHLLLAPNQWSKLSWQILFGNSPGFDEAVDHARLSS